MFKRLLVLTILNDKNIELHIPTIITRLEIKIIFPIIDISSLTQSGIHGPSDLIRDFLNIFGPGSLRSEIFKFFLGPGPTGLALGPDRTAWPGPIGPGP